eukprot:2191282-Prymnesium_polylepis.2
MPMSCSMHASDEYRGPSALSSALSATSRVSALYFYREIETVWACWPRQAHSVSRVTPVTSRGRAHPPVMAHANGRMNNHQTRSFGWSAQSIGGG